LVFFEFGVFSPRDQSSARLDSLLVPGNRNPLQRDALVVHARAGAREALNPARVEPLLGNGCTPNAQKSKETADKK
jgi:hypothetical protein